ncbi:hypothetical protein OIU79_011249 [Salix purpurea]|uniref:Uncharacterized protein n=1 Tax=Salix purpurea TaxID=77065 RepID=A0A9Q0T1Z9_SALPP|nr:hypothetical protein OIU79_011249 [Salix purpurea]
MDQPLTNFAEICSHFVPCIYILVYRNNLQLQGNTLIQTLMVESSPRGMDQADIRSIPTSNQVLD